MGFGQKTQLESWSFSRYNDYTQCPAKTKFKHLMRLKEPGSPQMQRGSDIHTIAEKYLKGELPPKVPPELKAFEAEFKRLRALYKGKKLPMYVEDDWAFTKDWDRTRWDDWAGCFLRVKLDCAHYETPDELVVTDWKTGKFSEYKYAEYLLQMELYALSALTLFPDLKSVSPRLMNVDYGKTYPEVPAVYTRADLPALKKKWAARIKPMMADKTFKPKPNTMCRFCFYRKSNGGPCPTDN